jgi:hypothetical protein
LLGPRLVLVLGLHCHHVQVVLRGLFQHHGFGQLEAGGDGEVALMMANST